MKREKWERADEMVRNVVSIRDGKPVDLGMNDAQKHYVDGWVDGAEAILKELRGAA